MTRRLRTVVVGFGQVADTLGDDARMRQYFRDASHAEVLAKHPTFDWDAVIDPSEDALRRAREKWGIEHTATDLRGLGEGYAPDVAVIAAPPSMRLAVIEAFPSLSGLLVEKPLGHTVGEARRFAEACEARGLAVQVHFWRRGVAGFQDLASGGLRKRVGAAQGAFAIYGRGLFNNGSHLVDFIRMLLGEVVEARALAAADHDVDLPNDFDIPFALRLENGLLVTALPVKFAHYREVALDIWGTTGRLSLMQESLSVMRFPVVENRGLEDAFELASDKPESVDLPVADAYRTMYDNVAAAVTDGAALVSSAGSALQTMEVLDAICLSAGNGGRAMALA